MTTITESAPTSYSPEELKHWMWVGYWIGLGSGIAGTIMVAYTLRQFGVL